MPLIVNVSIDGRCCYSIAAKGDIFIESQRGHFQRVATVGEKIDSTIVRSSVSLTAVKARTEEVLYLLLWACEKLAQPRMRTVGESFEGWAYRTGLMRRLTELERRKLIERSPARPKCDRLVRLTREGRLRALGGRDPDEHWTRDWDGKWRLAVFDVPLARDSLRKRLRRHLQSTGFGCLQHSVWVTPHPISSRLTLSPGEKGDVESLMVLEAKPVAGETDAEIVAGAWDFERINRRYARHLGVLDRLPEPNGRQPAVRLRRWASEERVAWEAAVSLDPLLPSVLLPADYLGRKAWFQRIEVLDQAARNLEQFGI